MVQYLIKRLILMIPTIVGVIFVLFTLTRFVPGGPLEKYLREMSSSKVFDVAIQNGNNIELESLKEYYGLNLGFGEGFYSYLKKVFTFDFGYSFRYSTPVLDLIKEKISISLYFGIFFLFFVYFFGVLFGILKAYYEGTLFDRLTSFIFFFFYAVPSYLVGISLFFIFAVKLEWFPLGDLTSQNFSNLSMWGQIKDLIWHGTLPLLTYILTALSFMTLLLKNSFREERSKDYVKMAYAKGAGTKDIFLKHILKNALVPLVTHLGNNLNVLISGSFLIETIFNIDGMGLLGFESIMDRDYPVVLGILVISSFLTIFGHLLSDILIMFLDPRIKLSGGYLEE